MILAAPPASDPADAPHSLGQRLAALGVAGIGICPDGTARGHGPMRWIEQVIVRSSLLRVRIRQQWDHALQHPGELTALWPGAWIVSLATDRRRRRIDAEMPAALLLGPELLDAEQLHAICQEQHLDLRATVARIDPAGLLSDTEARRLGAVLGWMCRDAAEADRRLVEVQNLSRELSGSYEELSLLYKLSTGMTLNQPPAEFLIDACRELQQVAELRWLALQMIDEPRLDHLAGQTFVAGPVNAPPLLLKQIGLELLDRFGHAGQPVVVEDIAQLELPALSRLTRELLVIPLRREGRPLAILFGSDKHSGDQLHSGDSKLCDSLANSLTIFLHNMMLYEDVQAMFLGTLRALTSAIDAKDSYTHGHSERVALLSRMLAQAVGLDEHTVERVHLSGLVHDVGKIGVPESVLCKPGKLTDEEFAAIRKHPEIGARILKDIRQMQDLIPGVLHHHEQWCGRGYPHKLAGERIPLFGRLIGLADAFDAMSSNRTYRSALSLDQVLGEIRRCSGTQFDPAFAQVFVDLDFEPYYDLMRRHQSATTADAASATG